MKRKPGMFDPFIAASSVAFGALFMFLLMITVHLAQDPLTADSIRDWIQTEIAEESSSP